MKSRTLGVLPESLWFLLWLKFPKSQFLITKTVKLLLLENQQLLQSKLIKILFSNLTVSLWGSPRVQLFIRFFSGKDILRKETSAIQNSKKQDHNPEFIAQGVCQDKRNSMSATSPYCVLKCLERSRAVSTRQITPVFVLVPYCER